MHDNIEIQVGDGVVHVLLTGELDLLMAPALRDALAQAITFGHDRIEVSLREVTFLDSTGLGAIVQGHRLATEQGAVLSLTDPIPSVRRVLVVTGLDGLVSGG